MVRAVFCDIGEPIYDDENFVTAVLTALDELRVRDGNGPAEREQFHLVYNRFRARQNGSVRGALAEDFLGDAAHRC